MQRPVGQLERLELYHHVPAQNDRRNDCFGTSRKRRLRRVMTVYDSKADSARLHSNASFLAKCTVGLIDDRLHQVGQHRSFAGVDEGLDRHSGHELDRTETRNLRFG